MTKTTVKSYPYRVVVDDTIRENEIYVKDCEYCSKRLAAATKRRLAWLITLHMVGTHPNVIINKPAEKEEV